MKILKTKSQYYSEIRRLAKSKPSFFYVASFNFSVDDSIKDIFSSLPKKCDTKLIVGVTESISSKAISFLRSFSDNYNINLKLFKNCHLKIVISDNGAIIGGRNLTNSDWEDLSVLMINKKSISEFRVNFNKTFSKRGI